MQFAGAGHVHPHRHVPVLDQDGSAGVLEDDVILGVAPVELALDFGIQVVAGVLGLPVAPGHAQGVLDGAVGNDAGVGAQLRDQHQLLLMVPAIRVQAELKGGPDIQLAIGAARRNEPVQVLTVAFYVGVIRHSRAIIHYAGGDSP